MGITLGNVPRLRLWSHSSARSASRHRGGETAGSTAAVSRRDRRWPDGDSSMPRPRGPGACRTTGRRRGCCSRMRGCSTQTSHWAGKRYLPSTTFCPNAIRWTSLGCRNGSMTARPRMARRTAPSVDAGSPTCCGRDHWFAGLSAQPIALSVGRIQ